jgi:hypothetical protein
MSTQADTFEELSQSLMNLPADLFHARWYLLGFSLLEGAYGVISRNLPYQEPGERNTWSSWGLRHLNLATLNLAQFSLYDGHRGSY